MALALAVGSALVYGTGDFLGGLATKRVGDSVPVVAVSSLVGVALLLVLIPVLPGASPSAADLAWGGAGGVAGGTGVILFYRGLATGVMSVVAPVTAVTSAVTPVAGGLLLGERPGPAALVGVGFALVAVALLARRTPGTRETPVTDRRLPLLLALGAGLGFGMFFIFLDRTGDDAGMWPLVASRSVTFLLCCVVLLVGGRAFRIGAGARALTLGTGVLDMTANVLFLLANREGLLSLVGVIVSLYPASTIGLALAVLGERLERHQVVGVALATVAIVLIAAS